MSILTSIPFGTGCYIVARLSRVSSIQRNDSQCSFRVGLFYRSSQSRKRHCAYQFRIDIITKEKVVASTWKSKCGRLKRPSTEVRSNCYPYAVTVKSKMTAYHVLQLYAPGSDQIHNYRQDSGYFGQRPHRHSLRGYAKSSLP